MDRQIQVVTTYSQMDYIADILWREEKIELYLSERRDGKYDLFLNPKQKEATEG